MTFNFYRAEVALASVSVLKNLFQKPIFKKLGTYIHYYNEYYDNIFLTLAENKTLIDAYADFVAEIYIHGGDLGEYIRTLLDEDENVVITNAPVMKTCYSFVFDALERELRLLSNISSLSFDDLTEYYADKFRDENGKMPARFVSTNYDFYHYYTQRLPNVSKLGYGIYSSNAMFNIDESGKINPVAVADSQSVDDLIGYESQRNKVISNSIALLENKPAANVLLYGAAGTGKSSTVKATVNLLFDKGLRLIEIKKHQLPLLPQVMQQIWQNPLKFIIFIDDLTFSGNDEGFGTLKAVLEGSASAKSPNAVIYATSNRRHMVKESFSDREGDEIHLNDTIEEQTSLSERFGMTVLFDRPNKVQYFEIVLALAKKAGLQIDDEQLKTEAEAYALRKGGRSARAAKQFVELKQI